MKILVFGSNGLVGSSLKRILPKFFKNEEIIFSTRKDADLFSYIETENLITHISPNIIINAAARVGGIYANNTNRTDFLIENLKINLNILESTKKLNNLKIINLGSSCIYPLNAENPIKEEYLLTGKLEPTNSPYALAKITAIELGNALRKEFNHKVINLMPTNLYGPNDNFSNKYSHVIPGLIKRMHDAKTNDLDVFKIWGSGKPLREFLFVDDLAECIAYLLDNDIDIDLLNVGSGEEISILDLAKKIKDLIGFKGKLSFDSKMPDGNPRKLLDSSKLNALGWEPKVALDDGLSLTYKWYKKNY